MFENIIDIAEKKCAYHKEQGHSDRTTHEHYLNGLKEEIEEAEKEIKKQNSIYLEDELADILRDYINVLVTLKNQGYISSTEQVIKTCFDKYEERILDKFDGIDREVTKKRQKIKREEKHEKRYNV